MSNEESLDPVTPDSALSESDYLLQLRRSMAGFLAHKIPFSLFEAGKNEQLRQTLEYLVSERLHEQQIVLEERLQLRLINEIFDGLPVQKAPAKKDPIDLTPEKLRPIVAPYLAQHISNDLLMPGHEKALARKIQLLVDEKLALDQAQVSDDVRYRLVSLLCQGMGAEAPPAPEGTAPATLPPTPVATPPVPASPAPAIPVPPATAKAPTVFSEPPAPPEKSPTKKVPKLSLRAHPPEATGDHLVEEIAFTAEHKRHLLFTLGTKLDPAIMETGDQKKIYQHIMDVLNQVCVEESVELDDEIKELLLNGILTGEGLEFQL